jgi:SagB-type dehydrogenase family enzyme
MDYKSTDYLSLSLLYHLNSEPWLNQQSYGQAYGVQYAELGDPAAARPLSRFESGSALLSLLSARRSCRNFADMPLSLEKVGLILRGAYAPLRQSVLGSGLEIDGRGAPSAGGLFPLELYSLVYRVEDLENGLYHYNAVAHQLEPLDIGVTVTDLTGPLLAQPFLTGANLVIFITAVFDRTLSKYGPRGYRYVLLEAGHVGQSLCLLAEEANLGSLCVGGYMDSDLNAALAFDGLTEGVVYCVGIGHARERVGQGS